MFGIFRRLSALEARVDELVRDHDPVELERLRSSVLNALRGLRRTIQAQDEREAAGKGSSGPVDDIERQLELRRGGRRAILPGG